MSLQLTSNALFAFAIQQSGAGSDHAKMAAGYENLVTDASSAFHYYPLTDLGAGVVKNQGTLPPEIGGRALPSGAFTQGTWAEGPVSMIGRLDNRLGWLLLAAMGDVSTVSNVTIAQFLAGTGTTAGVYTHIFRFYSTDQYFTPWLTIHLRRPHDTAASQLGEIYQDGKIRSLTLTGAAGAPVTVDADFVARLNSADSTGNDFDFNPSTWSSATYDDFDSFGVTSCDGHFKIEGTTMKVTNVAITVANNNLPPAQSMHIGTTHPLDFPTLGRTCQVTATVLLEDYNFYVSTFEGTLNAGTDATVGCAVYQGDLDVMLASQNYITGSEPYRIRIRSNPAENNVSWQVRPIRTRPNQPVVLQVVSNVLSIGSGDPILVMLQNAHVNYSLP